jgi:chemotaxis protein histidine kinase CheA
MAEPEQKKPAIKVRLYRFRNKLKDKTAGLGSSEGFVEIDAAAMRRAEEALLSAAEDYPDWVMTTITKLSNLHQMCVDNPPARRPTFEQIRRIAHDLKGQGGTFGYPLVTSFATSLHRFASMREGIEDEHVEIIKAHIDSMRAVVRDRVSGDGGDIGIALAKGLDEVIKRFSKRMLVR